MAKQIVWSPQSEDDLESILEYLSKEWNYAVATKFIDVIDILLHQISINPNQYPKIHKRLNIRKCVVSKHNTLYYRNRRNYVELLRIYDNRQNPENLVF
jgi:plasmid stabilization system protein ParE